jgi:hypothetical protein
MRHCAAEYALRSPQRIDVDPSIVARDCGKLVDVRLVDHDPFADAKDGTEHGFKRSSIRVVFHERKVIITTRLSTRTTRQDRIFCEASALAHLPRQSRKWRRPDDSF